MDFSSKNDLITFAFSPDEKNEIYWNPLNGVIRNSKKCAQYSSRSTQTEGMEQSSTSTQTSFIEENEKSDEENRPLVNSMSFQLAQESFYKSVKQMNSRNFEVAITMISEAIRLNPKNGLFYGQRAACHLYLRRFHDAAADLRIATELSPRTCDFYVERAKCCLRLGDSTSAEQTIKKCLEVDSSNFHRLLDVMNKLQLLRDAERSTEEELGKRNYQSCLEKVDEVLKISSESLHLQMIRLECLILLTRSEEAKLSLAKLFRSDPRNVDLFYLNGLAFYYDKELESALHWFILALKLDPDHKKAQFMRSKAKKVVELTDRCKNLLQGSNFTEILKVCSDGLEIENELPPVKHFFLYNRAVAKYYLGRQREAINDCSAVLQINPGYVKSLLCRAQCYATLFEFSASLNDLKEALRINDCEEIRVILNTTKESFENFKQPVNFYTLLGVTRMANGVEIKAAYKRMALLHHPDKHTDASDGEKAWNEINFKRVVDAYATLSDPSKRFWYDESLEANVTNGFTF